MSNDHGRRTWDTSTYERKAKERHEPDKKDKDVIRRADGTVDKKRTYLHSLPAPTKTLQVQRDSGFSTQLRQNVNKVRLESTADDEKAGVGGGSGGARSQSAFFCKQCRLSYMDSVAYLDHLNSRGHQKRMGMKMTVEKGSVEGVKERLARLKKEREAGGTGKPTDKPVESASTTSPSSRNDLTAEQSGRDTSEPNAELDKRKHEEIETHQKAVVGVNERDRSLSLESVQARERSASPDEVAEVMGISGFASSRR